MVAGGHVGGAEGVVVIHGLTCRGMAQAQGCLEGIASMGIRDITHKAAGCRLQAARSRQRMSPHTPTPTPHPVSGGRQKLC